MPLDQIGFRRYPTSLQIKSVLGAFMRIITGDFKNRVIVTSKKKAEETTTEMVREALFSILGDSVIDVRFADLFAGTGSVGLEALSRGARCVTFVEKRKPVAIDIKCTLAQFSIDLDRARVWNSDVFHLGENNLSDWAKWDIAFLDPPRQVVDNFMDLLISRGTLVPGTLVVVHRPVDYPPVFQSNAFHRIDERKYGRSALHFYS